MKWVLAAVVFGAIGWFSRDLWTEAKKAPVHVTVKVGRVDIALPAPSARKTPPKAKEARFQIPSQAGDRDNVAPGFATQGISYLSL